MRKLLFLAIAGGAAAWYLQNRDSGSEAPAYGGDTTGFTPGPAEQQAEQAATAPPDDEAVAPETADTVESEAVTPDTSTDPLVRQQENAAAAEAGAIGGPADTVTADVEPEMRPVVEGSGDAEETFEQTEDQGR